MKLPQFVTIGPFTVELVLCPHDIMYEVSEAQGAFVVKPPYRIYLDKDMMDKGGPDAINVLIHEFLHVGYYQYLLKEKEEETVVNSYGNFLTELLCRSNLGKWIKHNI